MTYQYTADPSRIDELLSIDEAQALLGSDLKWLGKDTGRLFHLLTRVVKTLEAYRQQIQQLHRDVQAANISRSQVGTPSTLSPLDAVRYLTPDQLASVMDQAHRSAIESAARQKREAKETTSDAIRLIHEVNLVIGSVCDDVTVPAPIRDRLQAVLDNFAHPTMPPDEPGLDDLFV